MNLYRTLLPAYPVSGLSFYCDVLTGGPDPKRGASTFLDLNGILLSDLPR